MTLLKLHNEWLQDDWLDAYGHLNESYYLVPFSNATWKMQDYFSIGVDYFEQTGCAIYTVETHLRYLQEVKKPANMFIESMILGADSKRIWFAHQMRVDDIICATGEFMVLHYNTHIAKTTAIPDEIQEKLRQLQTPIRPDWVERKISL